MKSLRKRLNIKGERIVAHGINGKSEQRTTQGNDPTIIKTRFVVHEKTFPGQKISRLFCADEKDGKKKNYGSVMLYGHVRLFCADEKDGKKKSPLKTGAFTSMLIPAGNNGQIRMQL